MLSLVANHANSYPRFFSVKQLQVLGAFLPPSPPPSGSWVGVVVIALAFHQCVPGSIPGPCVICGLSLLVLYSAPRGFSLGTPVFPSPQKPTFDLI